MTREIKLGLILGFSLMLVVAILIADHLSPAQTDQVARLDSPRVESPTIEDLPGGSDGESIRRTDHTPRPAVDLSLRDSTTGTNDHSQGVWFDRRAGAPPTEEADAGSTAEPTETIAATSGPNDSALKSSESPPADATVDVQPNVERERAIVMGEPGGENEIIQIHPDDLQKFLASPGTSNPGAGQRPLEEHLHMVKEGETLYRIAERYYGDGSLFAELLRYNADRVPDNGKVRIGVALRIPTLEQLTGREPKAAAPPVIADGSRSQPASGPKAGSAAPKTTGSDGKAAPSDAKYRTYTIQKNDRLWDIAKSKLGKGGRWQEIVDLNKDIIKNPNVLPVGKTIRLPHK